MLLRNLAHVLRSAGLTVVEVPGWQTRGYNGQDIQGVRGILWHHTVGPRASFATQNMPSLGVLTNGRPGLAGPLSQLGLGRDGTVYVVAAGLCNHAGKGQLPNIPANMGNHYLIGVEMESSGVAPWDWTPDQIRVAPHVGAALEKAYLMHLPPAQRLQESHAAYSSEGKIDPAGWPGGMDGLRASINAVLDGAPAIAPAGDIVKPAPVPAPTPAGNCNVLNTHVPWYGFKGEQPTEGRRTTTLAMQLGWLDTQHAAVVERIAELGQSVHDNKIEVVNSQDVILERLAELDQAINETRLVVTRLEDRIVEEVGTLVEEAVKRALASIETTVKIHKVE